MDLMHVHGMYYLRILGSQKGKKTSIEMLTIVPNSLKILVGSYICTVILMY